jgi:anthranilate synthase component 1
VHAIEKVPGWGDRATAPLARFFGGATIVVFDALNRTRSRSRRDDRGGRRSRARDHLDAGRRWRALPLPDRAAARRRQVDVDDARTCTRSAARRSTSRRATHSRSCWRARSRCRADGRDPFDVYRAMRVLNPSPYMYFLDLPPAPGERTRTQIAGASPETMVRLEQGTMTVRPLAGTRPRGKTPTRTRPSSASFSRIPRSAPST